MTEAEGVGGICTLGLRTKRERMVGTWTRELNGGNVESLEK